MKKTDYFSLKFENDKLIFLDQTKLPFKEEYVETDNYERIAEAIERLEIRGAPAIGIAAAYALALSVKNSDLSPLKQKFETAYKRLERTRPTAVNLFMALEEIRKVFDQIEKTEDAYQALLKRAVELHDDDICKMHKDW